jgi:hypothetical protein
MNHLAHAQRLPRERDIDLEHNGQLLTSARPHTPGDIHDTDRPSRWQQKRILRASGLLARTDNAWLMNCLDHTNRIAFKSDSYPITASQLRLTRRSAAKHCLFQRRSRVVVRTSNEKRFGSKLLTPQIKPEYNLKEKLRGPSPSPRFCCDHLSITRGRGDRDEP